jgi:hypothetical protein
LLAIKLKTTSPEKAKTSPQILSEVTMSRKRNPSHWRKLCILEPDGGEIVKKYDLDTLGRIVVPRPAWVGNKRRAIPREVPPPPPPPPPQIFPLLEPTGVGRALIERIEAEVIKIE